jgi:hypothetical protein
MTALWPKQARENIAWKLNCISYFGFKVIYFFRGLILQWNIKMAQPMQNHLKPHYTLSWFSITLFFLLPSVFKDAFQVFRPKCFMPFSFFRIRATLKMFLFYIGKEFRDKLCDYQLLSASPLPWICLCSPTGHTTDRPTQNLLKHLWLTRANRKVFAPIFFQP